MKWLKALAAIAAILAVGVAVLLVSGARGSENPVGLQVARVDTADGPVAVAIWYPTTAKPWPTTFMGGQLLDVARDGALGGGRLPLVVLSHGNGGSALAHVDLAMSLASAGYVVMAPTHAGDNFADPSRQGSPALFSQRATQMRATIDYALGDWSGAAQVDAGRIGAFGFSAGGFTVLTLAGGKPDMAIIRDHCRDQSEFVCDVLRASGSSLVDGPAGAGAFAADARLKAAVVVAPGLGFTFADGGLAEVGIPVQVWSGELDSAVPYETNTRVVEQALGSLVQPQRIPGAGHASFLAPCGLIGPPDLCSDPAGFDREAVHAAMNAAILAFFDQTMPEGRGR